MNTLRQEEPTIAKQANIPRSEARKWQRIQSICIPDIAELALLACRYRDVNPPPRALSSREAKEPEKQKDTNS
jgi:hypothetical protein